MVISGIVLSLLLFVMAGLVPAIHFFLHYQTRRGYQAQGLTQRPE
jgi:hypothetical protein